MRRSRAGGEQPPWTPQPLVLGVSPQLRQDRRERRTPAIYTLNASGSSELKSIQIKE